MTKQKRGKVLILVRARGKTKSEGCARFGRIGVVFVHIFTVAIVIAVIIMTLVYWSVHLVTRRIEVLESLTFLVTRVT